MIFYFIGGFIVLYGVFNYKKGFMSFLAFKLFLVQDITVISIPGVPLLTLDMLMSVLYVGLYLVVGNKNRCAKLSFPFTSPFIILSISWAVSSIFSVAGFGAELSALIGNIINEFIIIVIAWNIIETKDDFDYIFSVITIIIFISCVYGFFEYSLQANPLSLYESTLNNDPSRILNYSYGIDGPRGYHAKSIFEHAIGAGMVWALYCAFVFMSSINYGERLRLKYYAYVTAALCVPLIMLTKQRSGMVFLLVLATTFIKPRKKKTYYLLIPAVLGLALFYNQVINNIQLLMSIFNSSLQKEVSGSSITMRVEQFTASFEIMRRSPVWGLGSKYRNILSDTTISLLRGVESIWFVVIPCYGIIGVCAYINSVMWSIVTIPRFFKAKNLYWLMIGYWLVNSMTSLPGFRSYLLYLVVIYIIKKSPVYKGITGAFQSELTYSNYTIKRRKIYK